MKKAPIVIIMIFALIGAVMYANGFFTKTSDKYSGTAGNAGELSVVGFAGFQLENGQTLSLYSNGTKITGFKVDYSVKISPSEEVDIDTLTQTFEITVTVVTDTYNGSQDDFMHQKRWTWQKGNLLEYTVNIEVNDTEFIKTFAIYTLTNKTTLSVLIVWSLTVQGQSIYGTPVAAVARGSKGISMVWVPPSVDVSVNEGNTTGDNESPPSQPFDVGGEIDGNNGDSNIDDGYNDGYNDAIDDIDSGNPVPQPPPTSDSDYILGYELGVRDALNDYNRVRAALPASGATGALSVTEGVQATEPTIWFWIYLIAFIAVSIYGWRV